MNKEIDSQLINFLTSRINFFLICIGLYLFGSNLLSESYSKHRLDDDLYRSGGGREVLVKSRLDNMQPNLEYEKALQDKEIDNRLNFLWNLYAMPRFLSRKGGRSEDLESGYQSQMQVDPEFALLAKFETFNFYTVLAPSISYEEEFIVQRQRRTLHDYEAIIGLETSYFQGSMKSYLQGGRGFQRLDRYGFIMADRMNFLELGNLYNLGFGKIGLSLLGGNYNLSQLDISPRVWNEDRSNVYGGSLVLENWWDKISVQFLHYTQVNDKNPQDLGNSFKPGEKSGYNGLELNFKNFLEGVGFGAGAIQFDLEKDFYLENIYQAEPKRSYNSRLYYAKIEWSNSNWYIDLGFFLRNNEIYKPMKGSIQMLGGSSSALIGIHDFYSLGQFASSNQTNYLFSNYENSRANHFSANQSSRALNINRYQNLSLNSGAFQVAGFHISKRWIWFGENFDTGFYMNTSNSYLGNGFEGILRFGWNSESKEDRSSFAFISFAQAGVIGAVEESDLIEGISSSKQQSDYVQFYISSGLKL